MNFVKIKQLNLNGSVAYEAPNMGRKRYTYIGKRPDFNKVEPVLITEKDKKFDYLIIFKDEAYYPTELNALLRFEFKLEDLEIVPFKPTADSDLELHISSRFGKYQSTCEKLTKLSEDLQILC